MTLDLRVRGAGAVDGSGAPRLNAPMSESPAALTEQPADEREERPHREEEAERLAEAVAEILHAESIAWRRRTASARCAAWTGRSGRTAASARARSAPRLPTGGGRPGGGFAHRLHARERCAMDAARRGGSR